MVTKTEDVTNSSITVYQYDQYGNVIKTTTEVTKDGETTVTLSESTYDILGRVTSTKSGDSETVYTYDAEGRTLLVNADGMYRRTVYDSRGRTVQEIEDADYNPELDDLPDAYGDTTVGQRYFYDENGSLIKEINRFDLETDYTYSDNGTLYLKHFDIYDYYYNNKGDCTKVTVNSNAVVEYDYEVDSKNAARNINHITYANGCSEKQIVNNITGRIMSRYYNDSNIRYYKETSSDEQSVSYTNTDLKYSTTVAGNENNLIIQKINTLTNLDAFTYKKTTVDSVITIEENHFHYDNFKTVINDKGITYS